MNGLNFINAPCFYVEIGHGSLQALNGGAGLELPLERQPNGRLTAASKEKVRQKLPGLFKKEAWQVRPRVWCAIGARGVLLRRFTLPVVDREEVSRLVPLQMEKELPLSPEELAWGCRPLGQPSPPHNGSGAQQEFLVAAVRKEVVEDYAELLTACDLNPSFTLAALARSYLCPRPPSAYAVLDIGGEQSELASFEGGVLVAVRVLSWGEESITQALAEQLGLGREEAERVKSRLEQGQDPASASGAKAQAAFETAVEKLVGCLEGQATGQKLYVSGRCARNKTLVSLLSKRLPRIGSCEAIEGGTLEGRSAAVLGLKAATENRTQTPPLQLQVKPTQGATPLARPAPWKYVAIAALLLICLLATPYAEALLLKGHLAKRLAALKADRTRLPMIDRELEFLQYLKQNAPPYLDTLYLLSKSAPQGAKVESLSMNRRGELSLRVTMKDPNQVADFRKKLTDSGLFANLTVEEQAPSPDRQKLMVRMGGLWKAPALRRSLALGPSAEEIEKAKTRVRDQPGMPPMMPPGMMGMPGPMMPGPGMPGMPGMGGGSPRTSSSRRTRSGSGPVPGPGSSGGGPPGFSPANGMPGGGPVMLPPGATPPNQP